MLVLVDEKHPEILIRHINPLMVTFVEENLEAKKTTVHFSGNYSIELHDSKRTIAKKIREYLETV